MIIVAGYLTVDPGDRDAYLAAVRHITAQARTAPGCLDFVQSPDPMDPARIVIYERWDTDADLERFRSGDGEPDDHQQVDAPPAITGARVHRYRISTVEPA